MTFTKEYTVKFNAAFNKYIEGVQEKIDTYYNAHGVKCLTAPFACFKSARRRYIKIICMSSCINNNSRIHSFVDKNTGNIYGVTLKDTPHICRHHTNIFDADCLEKIDNINGISIII